ncbi:hypothetical protein N0V95_000959 [Ascochyta clinopodiicola]|nr:hypothetical protein N0V95_000959 [Ascochyta clinopodiicola]
MDDTRQSANSGKGRTLLCGWWPAQAYPVAKTIFLHTLHGLEFLHKNGVVHGDLQPGNLLFSIENLDEVDQQQLEQNETNTAIPLRRIDGKIDRWAPRSVYQRQTLHDRIKLDTDFSVKLSDFGAAFFMSDPPESSIIPKGLRSPELILKRPFSHGIDIWSFGCLMHEFLTSEPLFTVMTCGYDQEHRDKADDDHLVQFNDKIRPLSESVMRSWPRKDQWYDLYHKQLCNFEPYKSLEQRFAKNKHPDIDDEEAAVICQLIRDILVYDPAERPSAAELLKHPWFSE